MFQIWIRKFTFFWFFMLCTAVTASSYDEKTVYTQALLSLKYTSIGDGKPKEKDLNGKYAQHSLKSRVSGVLFHSREIEWCDHLSPKTLRILNTIPKNGKWIALIPKKKDPSSKDNCTLSIKTLTAKLLNASGVIFYNDVSGEVPVIEDKLTIDIITVIIDRASGLDLIDLYETDRDGIVECEITVGTHYVDRRWKVSRTSVLFVLVSFILLMCISLAWLVFYYVQRFRHIYINDRKEV